MRVGSKSGIRDVGSIADLVLVFLVPTGFLGFLGFLGGVIL